MAASGLPVYNVEIANLLNWGAVIKMRFPHVGMRFYPLRADLARLQKLCDDWLNFTADRDDRPPIMFKPAAPFVLLQTVNYDRLEISDAAGAPAQDNLGWLRQHEAIFSVPLEWYRLVDGEWVFVDWAMTYPFIYLDHPISLWIGREMYGWPKMPVRVPRLFPLVNPPDPHGRVSFQLGGHSRRDPNLPEPYRSFIEINQAPAGFDTMASLADWWTRGPEMIAGAVGGLSALAEMAIGAGVPQWLTGGGKEPRTARSRRGLKYASQWMPQMAQMYSGAGAGAGHEFTPSPFMKNNIVLKQFRDAHATDAACYQALVKSELAVERVWGGGYLFNPMLGDPTGGVTIRLHHFDDQPIVETLGLQATAGVAHDGDRPDRKVFELKPFFPFWWDLDLSYGAAENLCWRSKNTKWSLTPEPGAERTPGKEYVIAGGGASVELGGERNYPNFAMLVMPLPADRARLARLCHDYLDHENYRFEPTTDYVLVVADQFREMSGATEPLARWADSELTFVVVGRYFDDARPTKAPMPAVMPMIGFVGSEWNAISDREVFGRFSLASEFVPANSPILDEPPPGGDRTLFYVRTSLCRALEENEQLRLWTLLGLAERPSAPAPHGSVEDWLRALGLESVVNQRAFDLVGLKQFRDASEADRACYQALVKTRREFSSDPEVAWAPTQLRLTIHEFETMELVKTFGIKTDAPTIGRFDRNCFQIDVDQAFVVSGGLHQGVGENLCWRASKMDWRRD